MTLHRVAQSRADLFALLEPIAPGRVTPYPSTAADVGPRVWLGEPTIQTSGQSSIAVEWPIVVIYDGADAAQVAGLDDIISRIWDACEAAPNTTPMYSRPDNDTTTTGEKRRIQVVTVRRLISARTLCVPEAPTDSPIPPQPVEA